MNAALSVSVAHAHVERVRPCPDAYDLVDASGLEPEDRSSALPANLVNSAGSESNRYTCESSLVCPP